MKAVSITAFACFVAAAAAGTCHYDCYAVTPAQSGADAKTSLLKQCGVTDSQVVTDAAQLQTVFKKAPSNGCTVAACGYFPNATAVTSYQNECEHPKPEYATLKGKGTNYNAECTTCKS